MVYWCLGGENPFFRPIYFQRIGSIFRRGARIRRRRDRWAHTENASKEEEGTTVNINEREEEDNSNNNNNNTLHYRILITFYAFLFGPEDDDEISLWHDTIAYIRRRAFIVVPQELACWLPAPPTLLSQAPVISASAASRFYAKPIPVPNTNAVIFYFYKLQSTTPLQASTENNYLLIPRRSLFPTEIPRSDILACSGCVILNLFLWLILRCFIIPAFKSASTTTLKPRTINLQATSTAHFDLLLFILSSSFVRILASCFLFMAVCFLLLPSFRIITLLIQNLFIDRANTTRAGLYAELQHQLLQSQPTDALPRAFYYAQQRRRQEGFSFLPEKKKTGEKKNYLMGLKQKQ